MMPTIPNDAPKNDPLKFSRSGVYFCHDDEQGVWVGGQHYHLQSRESVQEFAEAVVHYAFREGRKETQEFMRRAIGITVTNFDELRLDKT